MIHKPLGDSAIGVQCNADGSAVLLQIRDADGDQARAVLNEKAVDTLIEWLQKEKERLPTVKDAHHRMIDAAKMKHHNYPDVIDPTGGLT